MSDPFVAEIRIFAGDYAPRGWAFCDGQILPISDNMTLFSLIGTTYGGDGMTTTALPDLRGRAPMHHGKGPGLSQRQLGEQSGTPSVTLTEAELPQHRHPMRATVDTGNVAAPGVTTSLANSGFGDRLYQSDSSQDLTNLSVQTVSSTGGGQPHDNMQPYLAMNFIIALYGIYPPRP
ncbi:phage tail protein [Mesobaculum littorinae]|uniref:Phage tail protein n=1 Tax=Mesobaculum littorinae TaxID=2486419 RepID=A0A438AE93_9RHOB|nr:tail fiber protein [Mesobaculum littorinae]RVV96982.1 phage tail protein [Mesobaculum littorinae]